MNCEEFDHIDNYINSNIQPYTRELISEFAVLWNLYETVLRKYEHGTRGIDKVVSTIDFNNDCGLCAKVNKLYDRLVKYIKDKGEFEVNSLVSRYSIFTVDSDYPHRKRDISTEDLNHIMNSEAPKDRLYFLLLISTKVRNNMFHGIKDIPTLDHQMAQFIICNETLKIIIDKRVDWRKYNV